MDLASSLRRLVGKAYPEAVADLQDSLAKDQFIDALEDREIRVKIRESGPKTLDEAVSRALQIEAMYEAESRRSGGRSVRLVQEPPSEQKSELVELIKKNTAAVNQMVQFVQKQRTETSNERKQHGRGLGPTTKDRRERRCFRCSITTDLLLLLAACDEAVAPELVAALSPSVTIFFFHKLHNN